MNEPAAVARPTRARGLVVAMLFTTVAINYLDRGSISIAGPLIAADMHLSSAQLGIVFSAFAWAYSPLQIPGAFLVDRIGVRTLYPLAIGLWSVFAMLQGATTSMWQLVAARMGLGAAEAPAFPINNRVVTSWLPERERARGVACYVSGQYVGLAFLTPVLVMIQLSLGWRGMFFVTGLLGAIWAVIFRFAYRDPAESRRANAAELDLIRQGGGQVEWQGPKSDAKDGSAAVPASRAFRNRKLWGLLLAHGGETCSNWFFLTWFPTYLVSYRHIAFIKVGFLAMLPFLAACVGVLISGWLSDMLLRRGHSLSFARKTPIVTGLLLASAIMGTTYVDSPPLIISFMTVAYFGSGLAAISWSLVSTIAPINLVGVASGAFNFVGTSMGIVVPLVIGVLVRGNDFAPALVFVGCMSLMAVFSFLFIIGPIERVK